MRWMLAAFVALLAALTASSGFAQEPHRPLLDQPTGIRLSLPASVLAKESRTKWGTNWSTADRTINVDTLAYPEDQSFERLYQNLKGVHGRRLERDERSEQSISLAGRDSDGSGFHIELRRRGERIRGYSIVYQARASDAARRIIERLGQDFEPFPESVQAAAPPRAAGPPAHTGGAAPGEPAQMAADGITIQPNLGAIDPRAQVRFAPGGKYVAIGGDTQIKLWDMTSGRPLRILEHTAYFQQFAILGDGARILSVHKDGEARIWDAGTGRLLEETRIGPIEEAEHIGAMSHHPSTSLIVTTAWNSPVVAWDYARRSVAGTFVLDASKDNRVLPDAAVLSRDGKVVVVAGGDLVKRFDLATRREVGSVRLRKGLRVVSGGLVDDGLLLAKTAEEDCNADIVIVTLSGTSPAYSTLDRAPGCARQADGSLDSETSYEAIVLSLDAPRKRLFVARRGGKTTKVLELSDLKADSTFPTRDVKGTIVAVNQTAALAAVLDGKGLRIVKVADESTVGVLAGHGSDVYPVASADGRQIMMFARDGEQQRFSSWPIEGMAPRFHRVRLPPGFKTYHFVPDSNLVLGHDDKSSFVVLSILTGEQKARFSLSGLKEVSSAQLSPDGAQLMLEVTAQGAGSRADGAAEAWLVETSKGSVVHRFKERKAPADAVFEQDFVRAFGFSADSRRVAIGWQNGAAEVWSVSPPRLIKRLDAAEDQTTSLAFSPDDKLLAGGSRDAGLFVWNLETGKLLNDLDRAGVAGHVSTGGLAISHDRELVAAGPRQRAVSSGDIGRERRVQVWELAGGKRRFRLSGHEANVNAITFTRDGRWIVSASNDGTIRYWHRQNGRLGATYAAELDGRWVIVTDKGFFAASADAGELLSVVRGFEAISIEQMWQSLYAPDLVREYLAGDPSGEVKTAAANLDLAKVLDSGPAPQVTILQPTAEGASVQDLVEVTARIRDQGKGIGRIEWRVNGITAAVMAKADAAGSEVTLTQKLALDPGDNSIEVVAYNSTNLLASKPGRVKVRFTGRANDLQPTLHVLAIGINAYVDRGWSPPGSGEVQAFAPLNLAVRDARTLASALKRAGAGQYAEVKVTEVLDADATVAGLQASIERMASEISPRDTFVLFAAGHGISDDGRFFLIPQDYDGGTNPAALRERAVGQDRLQDWVANRIKAKRSILLLDTCESGALVGGYKRSRFDVPASEAAMGRLHEATGRPVLTAAAEGKPAFEGYEGHGVFTWTLLDALKNGDRDGNGIIELSELVSHVQENVPAIAAKLEGRGRAAGATRGVADDRQSARFGSRGENFALVRRLP